MPYIPQNERVDSCFNLDTPGKLNYEMSQMVAEYIAERGQSYQTFNDIVGVLECLKLEVYRRLVAPYEDIKLKENGDVF